MDNKVVKNGAGEAQRFLTRLQRTRVVQWAVAYAAGAWLLLQVAELLFDIFGWPDPWLRRLTVALVFGLAAVIVVAWYHGRAGAQAISPVEVVLLVLITGGAAWMLATGEFATEEELDARAPAPQFAGKSSRRLTATPAYENEPAWSPDSASLVYVSEQSGNRDLWVQQRNGDAIQLTSDPAEEAQPAWSPDGSTVLFVSSQGHGARLDRSAFYGYTLGGDICSIPAFGGTPRKLIEGGFNPAFAPDGGRIAFDSSHGGARRIWLARADGGDAAALTTDADLVSHVRPAWSPDGEWLAYERQTDTQASAAQLVVTTADGSESFPVTDGKHRDMAPAWAGARRLVFASDRGGAMNLWQVDVDFDRRRTAGEPLQVTLGAGEDFDPSVAADGSLAYSNLRRLQNLWRVAIDPQTLEVAGEPERLMSASWNDFAPSISSDGSIAFSSDRNGNADVYVRDGNGKVRQLTDLPGQDLQPVFSPDGTRIAFFSDSRGDNDIYVLPLAGGSPVPVTPAGSNEVNPYWSPDGSRFGFASDRSGQSEIWTMNVDGSDARQLSNIGTLGHDARWSPDGNWLLFTSLDSGNRDEWAVRSDGSELRRLTDGPTQDAHGLWSPDGTQVLYLTDHRSLHVTAFDGTGDDRVLMDLGETIDYTHLPSDGSILLFTREQVEGDVWLIE
jgi:Tol biopolymer transport system component